MFGITCNFQGQTVFSAQGPEVAESNGNSAFSPPESILATVELRDELTVLNTYDRLEVQAPHDCHQIQVMCLAELSWTQSMVAVVTCPVVLCAQRHG